jgi:AAA+ superfamily predicted ATPase
MKKAANLASTADHTPPPGVRLTAQDMARVRTLAAILRKGSSKPLVLGGRGAATAAPAVAKELGLDLHRIDLSAVVSKFIGETEKNLARLFTAAGDNAVVLLLDEADALFGKRTGTKDAHDRYSNAEINALLLGLSRRHGLAFFVSSVESVLPPKLRHRFSFHRFPR